MATTNFDKVVELVKGLTPSEQWRLFDMLEVWLTWPKGEMTEEEFEQQLVREGSVSVPPPPTPEAIARFRNRKPVEIQGKPLSETIIEERR